MYRINFITLYTITPQLNIEGTPGFGSSAFGAGGMFCAMITGIIVCIVFNLFGKFSSFKEVFRYS